MVVGRWLWSRLTDNRQLTSAQEGDHRREKLRHDAFLLFKDGINSVVQAGAKNVRVHIGLENNVLLYTMQFENKGCDMQQLNNLFNSPDMERRLVAINARMDVQVHKSISTFEMELPVS